MKRIILLATVAFGTLAGAAGVRAQAVTFQINPQRVVADAGQVAKAQARVAIAGAAGGTVTLWTNVGKFGPVKAEGKGVFTAPWTSPAMGFPTVAMMRADVKIGARTVRRWISLPISVKIPMPVQANKGENIQIVVGGKDFGPVKVRRTGSVSVPVTVDPGARSYTVNRTDEYNVTKADTRRFALPQFKRIALVGPKKVKAGQTIIIEAFQISSRGQPYTFPSPLIMTCPNASLEEIIGRKSVQKFRIKLSGRTGELICKVFMKSEPKVLVAYDLEVDVSQRLSLKLQISPEVLKINSGKAAKVEVTVSDLFQNITDTSGLKVTANGRPVSVSRTGAGQYRGWVYAPRTSQPKNRLVVRATAPEARPATKIIELLGGLAKELTIRVKPRRLMADGKATVLVEITARDKHGMPAQDRKIKVESDHGRMAFLHRVRAGLFRGRFIPKRNSRGGVAEITAQTYRSQPVSAKLHLQRMPQRLLLTPLVGSFGDLLRTVGVTASLRLEWAAYRGKPNVFIGGAVLVSPDFSIENGKGNLIDHRGFSAGAVVMTRLRLVGTRRFGLDLSIDVGLLGLYASYRETYGTVTQRNSAGRVAFTAAVGIEAAVVTTGQQEFFGMLQARYLTGRFEDAEGENRVVLFGGIGYRFTL